MTEAEMVNGLPREMRLLVEVGRRMRQLQSTRRIVVQTNARLQKTLATSTPGKPEIRLRPDVLDAPDTVLREVLAHELAHILVNQSHPEARPHGTEWQALMRQAGFEPRTHIPFDSPGRPAKGRWIYIHECPVCHSTRRAKRPVPNWRCRPCVDAGLDGTLTISRRRR